VTGGQALRIGTRGSALALAQAHIVRDALADAGVDAILETIVTDGDRRAPDTPWGEGAFVSAIEDALLSGRVDVAVHSAKDVPTDEDPRLTIAAFLPRAAAGDVLVASADREIGSLDDVPAGARVGTDSPRRTAFLRAVRDDLELHPLHGNVDTRLRRLDAGETDVLVLAEAGLDRLGRADRVSVRLDPGIVPPAPGQGALAVQVRADDDRVRSRVARLDDPTTRRAVLAERALLAASGGGCRAPLGAHGTVRDDRLELTAGYARTDGRVAVIAREAAASGGDEGLVESLLCTLSVEAAGKAAERDGPRVLVTRPVGQAPASMLALVDRGLVPISVPAIEIVAGDEERLDELVGGISTYDWVILTSVNAARAVRAAAVRTAASLDGPRWAVVGRATERALLGAGVTPDLRPERSAAAALADALPLTPGQRILLPRSDLADDDLPARLEGRGARVETVIAYRTLEAPPASIPVLEVAVASPLDGVVFASPSAARGLLGLASVLGAVEVVQRLPAVCIGPGTGAAAGSLGFTVVGEAPMQGPGGIADAAADAFVQADVRGGPT
jgi:hydroxymethylbilane synthase